MTKFLHDAPVHLSFIANREIIAAWIKVIRVVEKGFVQSLKRSRELTQLLHNARKENVQLTMAGRYALELLDKHAQGNALDTFKDGFGKLLGLEEPEEEPEETVREQHAYDSLHPAKR